MDSRATISDRHSFLFRRKSGCVLSIPFHIFSVSSAIARSVGFFSSFSIKIEPEVSENIAGGRSEERAEVAETRRSAREKKTTKFMNISNEDQKAKTYDAVNMLQDIEVESVEYDKTDATIIASFFQRMNRPMKDMHRLKKIFRGPTKGYGKAVEVLSFLETFSLKKGIAKFGQEGKESAIKEMRQLHERGCIEPIDPFMLTEEEKKKAMESFIFMVEKKDGTIKSRTVANGSQQRSYTDKDASASPTTSIEAIMITAVIDAMEERDVATIDIPNAFIQTDVDEEKDGVIVMKIRGALIEMLEEIDPVKYKGKG